MLPTDALVEMTERAKEGFKIVHRVYDRRNMATKDLAICHGTKRKDHRGIVVGKGMIARFEKIATNGNRIGIVRYDADTRKWVSHLEITVKKGYL